MKKILLLILLLFSINVYAEEIDMTLYKEVSTIEELNDIDKYENLKELLIRDVNINDISFINHLSRLEKLSIFYSRVDLTKINNPNIKEVNIISSYIINDDLSHLANSNIKKLDLGGSYITSIFSLKNVISLEELSLDSITNLKSLEPITYLPNLKILNFNGSEDLIKAKVYNYILDHKIVGKNYDSSKYMYLNGEKYGKELDDIISSLNLDNLDELEKIRKITLYVTSHIDYDVECGENNNCSSEFEFNSVAKSLSGKGICYEYALLTNKLLNRVGIKSYLVSGFTTKGLGHEWINVYLNGRWYGLDPTWIDTYPNVENTLRKTGKSNFFMIDLETTPTFYKIHLEDVLPSKIVDPNAIVIENYFNNTNTTNNIDDQYYNVFIICIIILCIFILGIIYKRIDKLTKKKRRKYVRR